MSRWSSMALTHLPSIDIGPDIFLKWSAGPLQTYSDVESVDVDEFPYLIGSVMMDCTFDFFKHRACKIHRVYTLHFLLPLHKYPCLHRMDNTPESRLFFCSSLGHTHFPAKRTRQPVAHFAGHFVRLQVTEFILSVQQMPAWQTEAAVRAGSGCIYIFNF